MYCTCTFSQAHPAKRRAYSRTIHVPTVPVSLVSPQGKVLSLLLHVPTDGLGGTILPRLRLRLCPTPHYLSAPTTTTTTTTTSPSLVLHVTMPETQAPAADSPLHHLPPSQHQQPVLNLIHVGLREASLDSPTFRCSALHFADNIDAVERWLDGYLKAASRLVAEVSALEAAVNSFLTHSMPPAPISEAVLDHDYTLLATRRYGEGAREVWGNTLRGVKRCDTAVIEPIRGFLNQELRVFKESRRAMDSAQKAFDAVLSRYAAQSKGKEASSLREEAFQLHEARKLYLKASMDFCVQAPQLRASLDQVSTLCN